MSDFKPERFLAELRKHFEVSIALMRKPEENWEKLTTTVSSPRDIYYYLVLPLLFFLAISDFCIQLFDGFSSAGLYALMGLVLNLSIVYLISLFLAYLNRAFRGERNDAEVRGTAPYIMLPWLISSIIFGVLQLLFPLLGGIVWLIIFVGATVAGMDMLYNYIVHFLKISPERKGPFFLFAFGGMIVISAALFLVERFLEYNYIER
jgi:hypothetical protein